MGGRARPTGAGVRKRKNTGIIAEKTEQQNKDRHSPPGGPLEDRETAGDTVKGCRIPGLMKLGIEVEESKVEGRKDDLVRLAVDS